MWFHCISAPNHPGNIFDQSDEETWPDWYFFNFWQCLIMFDIFWRLLTFFDTFDIFWQFWQFLKKLTIFINLTMLTFLVIFYFCCWWFGHFCTIFTMLAFLNNFKQFFGIFLMIFDSFNNDNYSNIDHFWQFLQERSLTCDLCDIWKRQLQWQRQWQRQLRVKLDISNPKKSLEIYIINA